MKLCRFIVDSDPCVGIKTENGILNLTALGFPASMNDIIACEEEMLRRISDAQLESTHPTLSEDGIKFLPVTEPKKIVCVGLNFKNHAEETGGTAPEHPIFFSKFNDTLASSGQPVTLPPWQSRYDYEAELVIIVGKYAYNVSVADAGNHIFGYTCGNDLSARDSQFLSSQWLSGKSFPGFAPTGPYIVPRKDFDPNVPHRIYCEVNGERVQSGDTADMLFNCAKTLSAASRFFPLAPGDLIFTGTPEGVIIGRPRDKRIWLKPGDIVKVTIDDIGTLTTPLV